MSNKYYEFENGVRIVYGKESLKEELPYQLKQLGANRVLLISGPVLNRIGTVDMVREECERQGVKIQAVFIDVPNDSSLEVVANIAQVYLVNGCDSILAVGGGSVMDTAKGVKLLLSQGVSDLSKVMGMNMVKKGEKIPFVLMPTTSGTGSEVTKVTVISDLARNTKLEFVTAEILPDVCVLDPILTTTLPPRATLLSGFDTLTHAIEGYTCTQKNPLSDATARLAIKLFAQNIGGAIDNPLDLDSRLRMMICSALAGASFSNSMVGAVHAIGHALGGECHLGHDISMSILLPYVMEFNYDIAKDLYGNIFRLMVDDSTYKKVSDKNYGRACIEYIKGLYCKLAQQVGAATKLNELGVSREQLEIVADKAMRDGAMLTNMKALSRDDVMNILIKAFE